MDTLNSSWGIFNDVLPGDPWQPEPAARYNAVNELLRQERFTTPAAPLWSRGELTCINVLNTSDQPLLFNRAVQIDTDFAGSEEKIDYSNLYACGRPVENENAFWGVALEDIEPGRAGMVQISGVVCLRHVWGEYVVFDPHDASKVYCRNDFIAAGSDGIYHLVNRGQARVIWFDAVSTAAVVMLNCHSYFYDGMFSVFGLGDGQLLVKGGVTDLLKTSYGRDVNVLEDTVIPVKPMIDITTYVCLTGTRNSAGGWDIAVEQSINHTFSDLYKPGERIVWPLASYIDDTRAGHVRALKQLHHGAVNFKERYYVE